MRNNRIAVRKGVLSIMGAIVILLGLTGSAWAAEIFLPIVTAPGGVVVVGTPDPTEEPTATPTATPVPTPTPRPTPVPTKDPFPGIPDGALPVSEIGFVVYEQGSIPGEARLWVFHIDQPELAEACPLPDFGGQDKGDYAATITFTEYDWVAGEIIGLHYLSQSEGESIPLTLHRHWVEADDPVAKAAWADVVANGEWEDAKKFNQLRNHGGWAFVAEVPEVTLDFLHTMIEPKVTGHFEVKDLRQFALTCFELP